MSFYSIIPVHVLHIFSFYSSAKIKNIEATEEAKQKLLQERLRKKDGPSAFVPTNMAVNFVQHNRCNLFISLLLLNMANLPVCINSQH